MKMHLGLRLGYRLRRFLAVALLSCGLTVGVGGCSSPDMTSIYQPIPPPNPSFDLPTSQVDSAGISHTYWRVTSPPSKPLSNVWVYVDNSTLGVGISLRASSDGSFAAWIEGQEGDRILFGYGASFAVADTRLCRPLHEGLASTPCQ